MTQGGVRFFHGLARAGRHHIQKPMSVIIKMTRKTAGELSHKALSDTTKYDALEVGHAMADDISKHLYDAVKNYHNIIDENEFCVVMVVAKDPLLVNLVRRKFYCWPYLPSPRPNQAVFLYNKSAGRIVKRLWVLPSDMVMSELASMAIVHKRYVTMQAWSVAFFQGKFWEYVRFESGVDMLSEHEYFLKHREELIKAGCKIPDSSYSEPFDFSKIQIEHIVDTQTAIA